MTIQEKTIKTIKALKGAGISYKGFAKATGLSIDTIYSYTRGATVGMTDESASFIIAAAKKCFPFQYECISNQFE